MNIAQIREKGNTLLARIPRDVLLVGILVLTASASFGLGIMQGREGVGLAGGAGQGEFAISEIPVNTPTTIPAGGQVVASRNGTKYFLPWCAGAKLISAANLVTFDSAEAAQAKGYSAAANCKGL